MAAKKQIQDEVDVDAELEMDDEDGIGGDDYVFILNGDGSLKGLITPENDPFDAPKNVKKICKILGLDHPSAMGMHMVNVH